MRQVRRILFVRTDRMGDVLMNLPAIRTLRQSYPKAWITLLLDKSVAGLFSGHPDLDELLVVDSAELGRSRIKRGELIRKIRQAKFDVGVVSNPSKFFHWLLFAAGIPVRAGWRRKWPIFLNRTLPDTKDRSSRHEIDSNLDLAGLVAKERWDGKIVMAEDQAAKDKVTALLQPLDGALPVVSIHPGSSNPKKIWPAENFIGLCKKIEGSRKCQWVLIGGEEEISVSRKIAERLAKPFLDLTGRLTLQELAAFFKSPRVRTLVSSDSGPVHVAWMSGKPVVAFYAADAAGSDPARWGPRDGKSEVIFKPMNEVSVDEVWERVQRFL